MRFKRRGRLQPLRNLSDRSAAAAAVDLALAGHTVLVTLRDGGQRLYRPQWASTEYPFRLQCPGCNKFGRYPRAKETCAGCWVMTPAHKRAIADANARRHQPRSADGR